MNMTVNILSQSYFIYYLIALTTIIFHRTSQQQRALHPINKWHPFF